MDKYKNATYHSKEFFIKNGVMTEDEVNKLHKKLIGLKEFEPKRDPKKKSIYKDESWYCYIFDEKFKHSQLVKKTKYGEPCNKKIKYAKDFAGSYFPFSCDVVNYHYKKYGKNKKLMSAEEVFSLLQEFGNMIFFPVENKPLKLF